MGTPLVERLDERRCRATFLWRGDFDTRNVAVVQDWGADGTREHHMTLLPGTDVWYTTWVFPADTRTTYQLSPKAPELLLGETGKDEFTVEDAEDTEAKKDCPLRSRRPLR